MLLYRIRHVAVEDHDRAEVARLPAVVRMRQHTSAYVSIRQRTSAYVSIRQHTSAHVSTRQHTSANVSIRLYMLLHRIRHVAVAYLSALRPLTLVA
jgi:hypothetical protein